LAIPQVSSLRRQYIPIGWLRPPIIPSDKLRLLTEATLGQFALLTSAMHMDWMRLVTGRLKSDYMYSVGVVYNTFPLPEGGLAAIETPQLHDAARAVLEERARHPDLSLAQLYDPDLMPTTLRRAHAHLDRLVDRLYRKRGFESETARAEELLARYEAMTAPLAGAGKKRRRKVRN
jgi:hypothetical protein